MLLQINYKDSLHIKDFGFDDPEKFLASLKCYVPIRFGSINGKLPFVYFFMFL